MREGGREVSGWVVEEKEGGGVEEREGGVEEREGGVEGGVRVKSVGWGKGGEGRGWGVWGGVVHCRTCRCPLHWPPRPLRPRPLR